MPRLTIQNLPQLLNGPLETLRLFEESFTVCFDTDVDGPATAFIFWTEAVTSGLAAPGKTRREPRSQGDAARGRVVPHTSR